MYQRLCETLDSSGKLIPREDDIYTHISNPDIDHYTSLYYYTEEHKKQAEEIVDKEKNGKKYKAKRGVAGITDVVTDKLIFDFDSKDDIEAARQDAINLVKDLDAYGIDVSKILVTFSGNKGFSVELLTDKEFTPSEAKSIAKELAKGMSTFDPKVYNASRVFRIPNTKHQVTGLYKTPLTLDELNNSSIDEIKQIAQTVYESFPQFRISLPDSVYNLKNTTEVKPKTTNKILTTVLDLNYANKPKFLSYWKYALLHGYFPSGSRSYALLILAATFKGQGMPQAVTYRMLKGSAEMQAERFNQERFPDDEIWNNIISQVYSSNWTGGTYSEDNFPDDIKDFLNELGIPRQDEGVDAELIEQVDEGFDNFIEYAENIDKYTIRSGIAQLDKKLKIRKGHLVGLIGSPGVGKTSIAVEMLNNMSKSGMHCFFGSYDMYKNNVYQKLLQRHTGMSEDQLFDVFVKQDRTQIGEFKELLNENYGNVSFCFKVGQSIEDLKLSIRRQEEKVGKFIDFVVIDYIELILTDKSDSTAASAEAAQGLREIANEGRVVLVLLQPNKMSSKPNEPMTSYNAAKGSSSIAQAVTAMLTCHRPGLNSRKPENDLFFSIDCVKNRNGALFSLDFAWDGPTQMITELDDMGKKHLEEIREIQDASDDDF